MKRKICMFGFSGHNTNIWVEYFHSKRQYEVDIITPRLLDGSLSSPFVSYFPLNRFSNGFPAGLRYHIEHLILKLFLKKKRYDAFLLQGLYNWSFAVSAFNSATAGKKAVLVWNDTNHRKIKSSIEKKVCRDLLEVLRSADLIITTWEQTEIGLTESFPELRDKIKCLPWGISDLFRGRHDSVSSTREIASVPDDAVLLMFGRSLSPNIRHDLLLDSMELTDFHSRKAVWYFALGKVSDSDWDRSIMNRIQEASLNHHIIVRANEHVPKTELLSVYRRADILLNIADTDQLSSSILEGFATRSIPVLSDIPAYTLLEEKGFKAFFTENHPRGISEAVSKAMNTANSERAQTFLDINEKLVWKKYDGVKNIDVIVDTILNF